MSTTSTIELEFWAGDEPTRQWTIDDSLNTLDLTGKTVTLHWVLTSGGTPASGAMTIIDTGPAPTPRVEYTFASGELDTAGTYFYEIQIDDGGVVETVPSPPTKKMFRVNSRAVS